ncbi:stage III sporulation protein AF [Garciella nitratireducens]|uniref:Stage III sporulation protein AF (Spore_III_AF) n=1 Tax=Garciella nitratireducens DSM 15102 TaxID=1121911 RepID=A0A1T4K437_9FIRM|nr:stage III sporulation protein AF [Garciella nitratireducens]SJZ37188.1 Stage III sporulation protein AF (Spore_III_AF) [Garciella nitratireducens DSM 15102]
MIEFLGSWIKNIAVVIIFITFLEILLPNNSMRKYIQAIAGLLVMIVILTPIIEFLNQDIDIQDILSQSYDEMEQIDMENKKEVLKEEQNKMAIELYIKKIESKIKNQVEEKIKGIKIDVEVEVFTNPKEENFSQIKQVKIYINKDGDKDKVLEKNNEKTFIEPIKRIEIGSIDKNSMQETQQEESIISLEEKRKIKEMILDFYNVPIENISISSKSSKQKNK